MKKICLAAVLLAVPAGAALAQSGTVNAYSSADEARARAAVQAAGYTPGAVAMAQGGFLFVKASKGADSYMVTVAPDGAVHAGPPLGAPPGVPAPPMIRAPGGRGAAPAGGPVSGGD